MSDLTLSGRISLKIKMLRKSLGLSQDEFGALCGFSRNKAQRLEKGGQGILVSDLVDIASAAKIEVADFFDKDTDQEILSLIAKYKKLPQEEKDRIWSIINLYDLKQESKEKGAGSSGLSDPFSSPFKHRGSTDS